jgi:hypothetical protein
MEKDISIRFSYGQAVFLNAVCKGLRISHFILKMYRPCRIVCPHDRDNRNGGGEQPPSIFDAEEDEDGKEEDEDAFEDENDTGDDVKELSKSKSVIEEEKDKTDKKRLKPKAPDTLNLSQSRSRGNLGPR